MRWRENRVNWQGLAEFQAVLRNLPDKLAREAVRIGDNQRQRRGV